jgi:hypothetical protein
MAYAQDSDPSITINFVNAGMSAGTTSTYSTTTATVGVINGKFSTSLSPQTNTATPTTDANTGNAFNALQPNQTCALVLGITVAGVIQMVQGPIIANGIGVTTTVGSFINAPQFPDLPSNFQPLAYTIVQTAPSASAWTPGSSSWTASGVAATTFQNIAQLPARPQIA